MKAKMSNINGILLIDKPQGWSSADVVRKVVNLTHGAKVGQMGTLDPLATGLLVIAIGRATKLFDQFLTKDKRYIGSFKWGISTNTQDITGEVEIENNYLPPKAEFERSVEQFKGEISQTPPSFSAKKVHGVPAYMLARRAQSVELKPKNIKIYDIKLLNFDNNQFTLDITCSSGTYIRTLGYDIAKNCGACATMTELRRIRIGDFDISDSVTIDSLTDKNIEQHVLPLDQILTYLPVYTLNQEQFFALQNGQIIACEAKDGQYRAKIGSILLGIANVSAGKMKLETYLYV